MGAVRMKVQAAAYILHIFKILCRKLYIFNIVLKIQLLVDPDKRSSSVVNKTAYFGTTAFLFPGGTLKNAKHTYLRNHV